MKTKHPNLVVVNAWHDDNKGDSGICEATLDLLQQHWPNANLGLVSIISEQSTAYKNAYRHLQKRFPQLTIAPSPFVFYDPIQGTYNNVPTQLPLALLRLLPTFKNSHPALQLIAEADLVIVNGGHYLFTYRNSLKSTGRLFRMLYPVLAAKSYGIPYIFFAQSLGSFDDPKVGDKLMKSTLNAAHGIWTREDISRQNVLKLGVNESNVKVIPDAAFALTPQKTERVQKVLSTHQLTPGKFWVVTVRQSPNGTEEERQAKTEYFLKEMASLIRQALNVGMVEKVALVVHVQGPYPNENDRIPTQNLSQQLTGEAVTLIDEDLSPGELSALYGEASLMLGTRFHSVIFSLIAGTPAYAISYTGPKTWGIMGMLGMQHLCADLENFSAEKALHLLQSQNLNALADQMNKKVNSLRQDLEKAIASLDTILSKEGVRD